MAKATGLAHTIKAMRPMLPAKDFEISARFYRDLGFQARTLTDGPQRCTSGRSPSYCRTTTSSSGPTIS